MSHAKAHEDFQTSPIEDEQHKVDVSQGGKDSNNQDYQPDAHSRILELVLCHNPSIGLDASVGSRRAS